MNFNRALHDTVQGHSPKTHNEVVEWGSRTLRHVCNQAYPESAMCVQKFDDSRGPAIRITYRISLRSSSLWEPRHPLLKVVWHLRHMRGGRRSEEVQPHPLFLRLMLFLLC